MHRLQAKERDLPFPSGWDAVAIKMRLMPPKQNRSQKELGSCHIFSGLPVPHLT